jgi:adenylate cyclase
LAEAAERQMAGGRKQAGRKPAGAERGAGLIDGVADWLMGQALAEADFETLFEGCCARLGAAGIPLWRAHVTFRILHPLYEAMGMTWLRGAGVEAVRYPYRLDGEFPAAFKANPFYHMIRTQLPLLRRRLAGPEALVDFPLLVELRSQGASDYFAYLISFGAGEEDGMIGSWATDRRGGFTEGQLGALQRVQQRLGVACKMWLRGEIAKSVVATYLGPDAGLRVLDGRIRRGDGETVHAAIWYSDLRDSTPMADRLPRDAFIQALNDYFECAGGAVLRHDGQILNFIGDAVLAIFPTGKGVGARRACRRALAAGTDAQRALGSVNRRRAELGQDPLSFGLALHLGDVLLGNIGVPERISHSVIGATVNEVARLEALTKKLERPVVASESFAARAPGAWDDLGRHRLRGVKAPLRVFAPATDR